MTDLEFLESLLSSSNSDNTEISEDEAYDNSMFVDAAEEGLDDNAKFLASLLEPDVPVQEEPERGFVDTIQRDIYAGIRGMQDGLSNMFSSDIKTASNWDLNDTESGIYSVFQNIPRWGITGALAYGSVMTGGLTSVGLGALSKASLVADTVAGSREVYKGIYEDALSRGLSESDASNSAAWGTAMSMPFELIGDAYMAKVFGKANARRIEKKLIASGAAERVEQGNAIKVLDKEVAEGILQEEVVGNKKLAGLLPAPAEKEVAEGAADEVSDFISLSDLKEKFPISETIEKVKGKIPTKEEWEALKSKITDTDILEKFKNKVPTKEEWEALKTKLKDTASTVSTKKAEFIAARKAAQKAQLHIKDPELYRKILKEAEEGRGWRELFETAVTEGGTEFVQGRLENLGVYKNDPNMKFSEIFEGSAQDILLGAAGAGVLHGIAKGIGKSPIGKFSAKRIAEMHRRRFDLGDVFNETSAQNKDFQDDFYKAHYVFDANTGERVDWSNITDDGHYNITYQDGYAARNVTGLQAKKYAEKVVGLRVNPETNSVIIPADIEYKDAPGTLTVAEDGTTTITPDYSSLSDDPVKAEEQAVEQTEQTRAAIMRDQGIPEEQVKKQSPMPGAANQNTFGKLSEGSDIQDDIIDKPDTVEEEGEYGIDDSVSRKLDREVDQILKSQRTGKPYPGQVSKNHVIAAVVKFAKKYMDINIEPTIRTEGDVAGKPAKNNLMGQVDSGKSILKIRNASDILTALHELGHYLYNRGKRLETNGFGRYIGRKGTVPTGTFVTEMFNLWNNVMAPNTPKYARNPATDTVDVWNSNESDTAVPAYSPTQQPNEIFVEAFARYVANRDNFRQKFEQLAPETYRAFQRYLTERDLHDAIENITKVYGMYADQSISTRQSMDTSAQRPTLFQNIYDYIQQFIGDRQHLATIISKTIDNTAGLRHMLKELTHTYKTVDRFERMRGHAASAVKEFISGNGLRFGGGDLLGSRFRNYDSIIRDVQKLNNVTGSDGKTLTGVQRFDAYVVAKNTLGETIGNSSVMTDFENIAVALNQDLRTTQADIIDIKRNPNYDWTNSKYAPYKDTIEKIRHEGQWVETPETLSDAYTVIEEAERQPDFDRLEKAFNDYQYLWKTVQDYVSAMSPSMALYVKAIRAGSGAYYTPLMREIVEDPERYNAIITHREGSDRRSYSSLENTPAEISALIDAGLRAYTKDMLVDMANLRDSGVYIHEVMQPQEAVAMEKVKEGVIKEVLKSLPPGSKLPQPVIDALNIITINTIYISNPGADVKGNIFSVVHVTSDGKPELRFYKTDPALLTLLDTKADADGKTNYILKALNYFNQMQKNWFTRYSLRFILYTNPLRDAFTASFRGNRILVKTGNKYIDNNWLNAIAGSLQGMCSSYMMWMTHPDEWQKYQDAMSAIGMSTNQIVNEYNAILSRTKPSTTVPQGSLGFLTSPGFKKFLHRMDSSDLIVRVSELEHLLEDLGADVEEVYLSKDRVCGLCLSKNKLESLGLKYSMIENILTNDQRTMWNNTSSTATLTLNLDENQYSQVEAVVNANGIRTDSMLTEEQLDMLNREVALCTTDFLRHGRWSDKLNILMLFSRAGINGTAQMGTWIDRRKMQGRSGEVYGKIASAAICGWLFTSLFGDDDEDEEEMWNSLRFKVGDVTIDLPVLPEDLLGWNMGKALANGDVNGTFVKHFAASINPIKSAGFAGLIADLVTDKKVSRVGWDDFASPIVPPYLKQKYGEELDKIVTYNTGVVARALPNIFGMTPAHWQYVINNMGFGKLVKAVETAAGVDKSVLLPDGSIIPTGHGSIDYISKQVGINRPLYRTRYERQLDDLFKEATTAYSLSPDNEDAKAKYLLLYNATHLQQNLNKLKFFATTPEQQKRLVAMVGQTAKNSYEAITGGTADLPTLRAANKATKAAKEEVVEQLKTTGEGTPATAYEETQKAQSKKRSKKKEGK